MSLEEMFKKEKEVDEAFESLVNSVFYKKLTEAERANMTISQFKKELREVEKSFNSRVYVAVRRKADKHLERIILGNYVTKEYVVPTVTDEEVKITVDQYGLASSTVQKKKHDDAFVAISHAYGGIQGITLPQNTNKTKLVFSPGNLSAEETLDMFEDTFESFINGFIQTLKGDTYQEKLQTIKDLRWSRSRDSRLLLSKSEERLREAALNQKINSK